MSFDLKFNLFVAESYDIRIRRNLSPGEKAVCEADYNGSGEFPVFAE